MSGPRSDLEKSFEEEEARSRQRRAQRPEPSFSPDIQRRMVRGKHQAPYESGNPDDDRFLRTSAGGQIPQPGDEPYYRDPAQFKELMQSMYDAGANNDQQAVEMIERKYGGSPLQPLMRKAYQEGQRSRRQPQQAQPQRQPPPYRRNLPPRA